jgi:hypothetical protein
MYLPMCLNMCVCVCVCDIDTDRKVASSPVKLQLCLLTATDSQLSSRVPFFMTICHLGWPTIFLWGNLKCMLVELVEFYKQIFRISVSSGLPSAELFRNYTSPPPLAYTFIVPSQSTGVLTYSYLSLNFYFDVFLRSFCLPYFSSSVRLANHCSGEPVQEGTK